MLHGDQHLATIQGDKVAEVAIEPGLFVCQGTAADECKLPTATGEVTATGLGFALLQMHKGANGSANHYAIGDAVAIVNRSRGFYAIAGENLAKHDPVFVVFGATGRGRVRNDASSGATEAVQLPGVRVAEAASSGEAVLIEPLPFA
jgi:hypothetical protein